MSSDTKRVQSQSPISLAVIVGLIVALFGSSLLGLLDVSDRLSTTTTGQMLANSALMWLLVVVIILVVLYWARRSISSIGLKLPTWREATVGVAAGVAGVVFGV